MKLIIRILPIIFLSSVSLFATTNSEVETNSSNFLTIVDSKQREITLENEPKRIISLAPSITEIIFKLGANEKLVGRTDYCLFPEEASIIESVGTLFEPSIEKIVTLNPDIILASTHFSKELLIKLTELKLKVIIINELENLEGLYLNILNVGKVVNKTTEAEVLNKNIEDRINNVTRKVSNLNRPTVYYAIGYGEYGDYTAGGDTFISQLIELAGGNNIAKDSMGWSYSLEKIVEKNPDIIICSKYYNAYEGLKSSTGYKDLPGIINGNLYTIDNNLIDIFGPRAAEGLEALAQIIHPEIFK